MSTINHLSELSELNLSDELRTLLARPLTAGAHGDLENGYCLLERHDVLQQIQRLNGAFDSSEDVAIDADEIHRLTDEPEDVASVLRAYGVALNDALLGWGDYQRLDLEPRLRACEPLLTDTVEASATQCERWSLMALDWLIRTCIPTWLRLVPALVQHAEKLVALPDLTTPGTDYAAVGELVRDAQQAWAAARAAAWAAARAAAWDAAWDAAWAAARDAARDAAKEQLAPTVRALQESALALFERMLAEPWRVTSETNAKRGGDAQQF